MSGKQRKPEAEEEGGCEVGLWYVSFADMITLLLSFFVMLTSFSSYDKESLDRIRETSLHAYPGIIPGVRSAGSNSLVSPIFSSPVQTHGTENSRRPTWGVTPQATSDPAACDYAQWKVIRIPLSGMFLGNSCALAPSGTRCVELLAKYMAVTPYSVHLATAGTDAALALSRQWKVASLLAEHGVPMKYIGLAAPLPEANDARDDLILTLLPKETLE